MKYKIKIFEIIKLIAEHDLSFMMNIFDMLIKKYINDNEVIILINDLKLKKYERLHNFNDENILLNILWKYFTT